MPSFRALPPSLRPVVRAKPPARTRRPSTSPSRGRWSTAASTATARACPASTPTPPRWTRCTNSKRDGKQAFVWIGLHEPDEHQMQAVADVFGLHELAVEDAVHAHQRPKLERYDNTLFLVLKTVNYVEHESVAKAREIVETGEIMIFVGPDFVVTVRHGDHGGLAGVRKRMDATRPICALGPYAVMHAIADHVVDQLPRGHRSDRDRHRRDGGERLLARQRTPTSSTSTCSSGKSSRCAGRSRPLTLALQRIGTDHNDLISKEVRRYMRDVARPQHPGRPTGSPATTRCSARWCRPRSARWRCSRTSTCARSRRGWPSPRCRPRWPASTA